MAVCKYLILDHVVTAEVEGEYLVENLYLSPFMIPELMRNITTHQFLSWSYITVLMRVVSVWLQHFSLICLSMLVVSMLSIDDVI